MRVKVPLLMALVLAACGDPGAGAPDSGCTRQDTLSIKPTTDKLDLLFVIDNGPTMADLAPQLPARFREMLGQFEALAQNGIFADLQIGVVTSDYGAGFVGATGCDPSPGGQRGFLQAIGAAAPAGCQRPTGNLNFLQYKFAAKGDGPNNLPTGQDALTTLSCMAAVGTTGCPYPSLLESAYASLHSDIAANAGFLRDDAMLAVVFISNNDDTSSPPSTDIFDAAKSAQYGYADTYRGTNFAIVCGPDGTPLPTFAGSNGPLEQCVSAPNTADNPVGKAYDIRRYTNFYNKPTALGGIRSDPADVILVGLLAPTTPFEIILSDPATPPEVAYVPCGTFDETSSPACVPVLQRSCSGATSPAILGLPSVRLSAVINAHSSHQLVSVCDGDATKALSPIFDRLTAPSPTDKCLKSSLPRDAQGKPVIDCVTEAETLNNDGSTTVTEIPHCSSFTGTNTCFDLLPDPACAAFPEGLAVTMNRHGGMPPAHTTTRAYCNTLCSP